MKKIYLIFLSMLIIFSSCGSKHKKGKQTTEETAVAGVAILDDAEAKLHFDKVMATSLTTDNLVAKVHAELDLNGETNSTSGTLRMRKGEGIQISLVDPLLGIMELGKLTFTPTEVMVVVRVKKQYVKVPYAQVSFLEKANINFNSLQSLFWHELFEPGSQTPRQSSFSFEPENENININYTDNFLTYHFITDKAEGKITKTEITGANDTRYRLWFDYGNYTDYAKKQFPKNICLSFTDGTKSFSLKLELSSLKNSSEWELSTAIPDGYDRLDFERIFTNLLK